MADLLVNPNNAYYQNQKYVTMPKDPSNPLKYVPTLSDNHGSNWFDTDTHLLWVVMRGNNSLNINMAPVIQVSFFFF